jgi:hypothetical protein
MSEVCKDGGKQQDLTGNTGTHRADQPDRQSSILFIWLPEEDRELLNGGDFRTRG